MKYLKIITQIIFIFIVILMLLSNIIYVNDNLGKVVLMGIGLFLLYFIFTIIYRKNKNNKIIYIWIGILFIIGIAIRIYLIINIDVQLKSDFKLYYDTAQHIIGNNVKIDAYYLSYNSYVYTFSSVLSIIIKIFGISIKNIFIFNSLCQIATSFLIYLIIRDRVSHLFGLVSGIVWFLLPTVIFVGFLVSTETFFMLLLMGCFCFFDRIIKIRILRSKLILSPLLGILIALANGIRPIMLIFIIALISYFILSIKKLREVFIPIFIFIAYIVSAQALNIYNEHGIGENLRSGALGWSIYFASNYESNGEWTAEDSSYAFSILDKTENGDIVLAKKALDRYISMGFNKTAKLMYSKFNYLWSHNNSSFDYMNFMIEDHSFLHKSEALFKLFADFFTIIILFFVVLSSIYELKQKQCNNLFLQIFLIGYVLSNLFVVLNTRYNFPVYAPLIIISMYIFKPKVFKANIEKFPNFEINSPKILLIIPAYNEQDNIIKTCESIKTYNKNLDFIVINDCSTDKTASICQENNYNHINLIKNLGIGGAVQTGYKYAYINNYDIAIQFDGDGQHDINSINNLIKPIISGSADFVVGSRFIGNLNTFRSTKMRRIGIVSLSALFNILMNKSISDITSGYRAANKEVIALFSNDYPVEYPEPESLITIIKKGFRVEEVPVRMNMRVGGSSSITPIKSIYYMLTVSLSMFITRIRDEY